MIFLVLAIISNSLMALGLKLAEFKNYNGDRVLIYNYFAAVTGALIGVSASGQMGRFAEIINVDLGGLFSPEKMGQNSIFFVYACGILSGVVYLINLVLMKYSIRYNGASITSLFGKTGFVISTFVVMAVWKEFPSAAQWKGIALAVLSIVLMFSGGGNTIIQKPAALLYMFVFSGVIEVNSKAFTMYALPEYKGMLPLVIFSVALVLCCFYVRRNLRRSGEHFVFHRGEFLLGLCVGLPNIISSFLMLNALQVIGASVYFSTVAVGGLLLVTAVSVLIFKEKLSRRQVLGMGLIIVSLIMINA